MIRMTKVAIGIPAHDNWKAPFGYDVAGLILQFRTRPELQSVGVELHSVISSVLPKSRSGLVGRAFKTEATHILWLDTDMRFPVDTLIRLLARKKPIVGANVRARGYPHTFTAIRGLEKQDRRRVKTLTLSTGIEAVDYMGLAVTLIETRVFKAVSKPWFSFAYENGDYIGEDCFFLRKARGAGFRPYIDHDLSKEVAHIANKELWFDSILEA